MDNIHWQLSILSKAIQYKNLSGAAAHVGLSQPQLSRIVARLEKEFGVTLLDRGARRKSGWTPIAASIAETYGRHARSLVQALQELQSGGEITRVSIGTLEGLIGLASEFCQKLFDQTKVSFVELNVYDLSELEAQFAKNALDLIFTCREPGSSKLQRLRPLGYQDLERVEAKGAIRALSAFEQASASYKSEVKERRILLSNSLAVRKLWMREHGASGYLPSEVRKKKRASNLELPVFLIGNEALNPSFWEICEKIRL